MLRLVSRAGEGEIAGHRWYPVEIESAEDVPIAHDPHFPDDRVE
jgi:hypothetical protein